MTFDAAVLPVVWATGSRGRQVRPERRKGQDPDYRGPERRRDFSERQEEWRLLRDRILLAVGSVGVLGITGVGLTVGVADTGLSLAALATFGGLLGLPTFIRADERRERNGG